MEPQWLFACRYMDTEKICGWKKDFGGNFQLTN